MSATLLGMTLLLAFQPASAATADDPDPWKVPDMVTIPAGRFIMGGSTGEPGTLPLHAVSITRFKLGKHEVTRGQFAAFVADSGWRTNAERNTDVPDHLSKSYAGANLGCMGFDDHQVFAFHAHLNWRTPGFEQQDDHPVTCVSSVDVHAYVDWLSRKTGRRFRLPSEAEFEYSARAKSYSTYTWGDTAEAACAHGNVRDRAISESGFYQNVTGTVACSDGYVHTAPVARFNANAYGLYDMIGNVMEWTEDCLARYSETDNDGRPVVKPGCELRVARGGAWASVPERLTPSYRFPNAATDRATLTGFRVAEDF